MRLRFTRSLAACRLVLCLAVGNAGASDSPRGDVTSAPVAPEAILYYFHRTLRCESCLTVEAYIDDALKTGFAAALESGRLRWLPTDIEEPANAHFEEDFALQFNSAILVHLDSGTTASWINLEKVWDLLDSRTDFLAYVAQHVDAALNAPSEEGNGRLRTSGRQQAAPLFIPRRTGQPRRVSPTPCTGRRPARAPHV